MKKRCARALEKEASTQVRAGDIGKLFHRKKHLLLLIIGVAGFVCALGSLSYVHVYEMGTSEFFLEKIVPVGYWIGIVIIASSAFLMINSISEKKSEITFILLSILLLVCIRMVFPIIFVNPIVYEPDITNYVNVLSSWVNTGINFGVEGNYQHDYPMAFLIGYFFLKVGVPIYALFKFAPLFIYSLNAILLYKICKEVVPNEKYVAVGVFVFSLSPLNYWLSVHFCPDLVGSVFFLVSLYFVIRFARMGKWRIRGLIPLFASIFVLILSHHLSILYLVLTLLGLSLSAKFFRSHMALPFLISGIYAYTLWFVYGTFVYPSFFNVYVYLQWGGGTIGSLAAEAPLLENVTFVVYPTFILALFIYGLFEVLQVRKIRDVLRIFRGLRNLRGLLRNFASKFNPEAKNLSLIYSFGFIFVFGLFLIGFVIPPIFALRVLEVLLFAIYPIAIKPLIKICGGNPSKKKRILMFCIIILVMLASIHRYYAQIQRRVLAY